MVVTYSAAGEAELTAFVVPSGGEPDEDDLRRGLLRTLPRNMVPARFRAVLRLPLSPHGKVDRAALAASLENRYGVTAA